MSNSKKLKKVAEKAKENNGNHEIIPPKKGKALLSPQKITAPNTLAECRQQLAEIFEHVARGEMDLETGTKLTYMLDKISRAIKDEIALEAMAKEYERTWTGLQIKLAPPKEKS